MTSKSKFQNQASHTHSTHALPVSVREATSVNLFKRTLKSLVSFVIPVEL